MLVSRTESKLQQLASEIPSKSNTQIQTKTLAMDFAQNKDSDYARLKQLVDGLDVAVLVNNVGKSHDMPVPFAITPEEELRDIVTINCMGTLRVTQLVVPGMIERKRGLVITMGSMGGLLPTPLLATYSGSKAFLQQWSIALGSELAPHNVKVQFVVSYLVTSAMSKIRRSSMMVPTARAFVKSVLSKIGRTGGAQGYAWTSTPFWSHGLLHWGVEHIPFASKMGSFVATQNRSMHEGIRKRALKKQERDRKKGL